MRSTMVTLVVLAAGQTVQAQRPAGMEAKVGTAAPAPIALEVVSITANPAAPLPGVDVTFTMTIRNAGTGTVLQVPWLIGLQGGNQPLGQGSVVNLAPGSTRTVTATWRSVAGSHAVLGAIDPRSTFTNTAPAASRAKDLTVNVPQVSGQVAGGTAPALETQVLHMDPARQAGASFADGGPMACVTELKASSSASSTAGLLLRCPTVGGRVRMTAFDGFTLKNGWVVKSVRVVGPNDGNRGWSWVERPQEGSNRPKAVLGLWSNPVHYFRGGLTIEIQGPAGTDPYVGR
ncbi:MAG: CARDB domain-containing protein [Gemmatimonadales bacterium]|nr:CARDB domain-containing protein [Gemmatimonadales bacterium]